MEGAKEAGMPDTCIICADNLSLAVKESSKWMIAGSVVLYENDLPDMFN